MGLVTHRVSSKASRITSCHLILLDRALPGTRVGAPSQTRQGHDQKNPNSHQNRVGNRHSELGRSVQDVACKPSLHDLPVRVTRLQSIAKDLLVAHARVLGAGLLVLARFLRPLPSTNLANTSNASSSRTTSMAAGLRSHSTLRGRGNPISATCVRTRRLMRQRRSEAPASPLSWGQVKPLGGRPGRATYTRGPSACGLKRSRKTLNMTLMKQKLKKLIAAAGWSVKLTKNLPTGIDWGLDLKRMVPGCRSATIFDVGANIGQTTKWLRGTFPSATIHAFEPIPATFKTLTESTESLRNVNCHSFALGAEVGVMEIAAVPNETRNSLATGIFEGHPKSQRVGITIKTIDTFCKDIGVTHIDILKTDTEGFDMSVMEGASGMLGDKRVSAVVSEITFDSKNSLQTQFYDLFAMLSKYGFLPCGFYETETLYRIGAAGSFCNAMFVRQDLLRGQS